MTTFHLVKSFKHELVKKLVGPWHNIFSSFGLTNLRFSSMKFKKILFYPLKWGNKALLSLSNYFWLTSNEQTMINMWRDQREWMTCPTQITFEFFFFFLSLSFFFFFCINWAAGFTGLFPGKLDVSMTLRNAVTLKQRIIRLTVGVMVKISQTFCEQFGSWPGTGATNGATHGFGCAEVRRRTCYPWCYFLPFTQ